MHISALDLNLLKVLDALLRERSTVRAGERVGLSQPAVSAALGRLRKALGDPLFVRHGQRIVPTHYAESLEEPLRDALERLGNLLAEPGEFDPAVTEMGFTISGSDFFAEMLMPTLAETISRRAPKMRVQLVDLVPDNYVETLERYEVDFALIPKTRLPAWSDQVPVFESDFVMVARGGHPDLRRAGLAPFDTVPLDVFCDLQHVLFSPEGNLEAMGDAALAKIGRRRRVVMTLPVFSGVATAVARSDLVALLPEQYAVAVAERLGLSIYLSPVAVGPVEISLIWHKRSSSDPAHRWLRARIGEVLAPLTTARFRPTLSG